MPLSTTRTVNDAGHVTDHNDIVTNLATKVARTDADAAYVSRTGNVGFYGTVPIAKAAALTAANAAAFTAAPTAAPAGGTGAAAGGWDTAANRDAAIATINGNRTRIAELETVVGNLRTRLNDLEARIRAYGLLP